MAGVTLQDLKEERRKRRVNKAVPEGAGKATSAREKKQQEKGVPVQPKTEDTDIVTFGQAAKAMEGLPQEAQEPDLGFDDSRELTRAFAGGMDLGTGLMEKGSAGLAALGAGAIDGANVGEAYDDILENEQFQKQQFEESNPTAAAVAEGVGNVAAPVGLIGGAAGRAAPGLAKAMRSMGGARAAGSAPKAAGSVRGASKGLPKAYKARQRVPAGMKAPKPRQRVAAQAGEEVVPETPGVMRALKESLMPKSLAKDAGAGLAAGIATGDPETGGAVAMASSPLGRVLAGKAMTKMTGNRLWGNILYHGGHPANKKAARKAWRQFRKNWIEE